MPINFNNADTLNRVQRLFDNPTGWSDRVISMLSTAFGGDNVFGTAATRDTGTAGGEVPLVNADGNLAAVIGTATTDTRGLTTTADLPTPDDSVSALREALTTIGAANLDARGGYFLARRASTPIQLDINQHASLLLISSGRQGGFDASNIVLTPSLNADAVRIHITGGGAAPLNPDGTSNTAGVGIHFLTQAQLTAFSFEWAVVVRGWGNGGNELHDYNKGDLLVAFKRGASRILYTTERNAPSHAFTYPGSFLEILL